MTTKPINLGMNDRVECAETLPSRFYIEPAILALEKERIFRRTWQLVGTLSHACGEADGARRTIADPGAFFTVDVVGEPVVVVRDSAGTLRAFSNVCRHRAGPIAQGSGCRNVFNCGYHGWTYTLDGRLIGTPEVDGMEFFDRSTMGMIPLRCETWEQFIFVNFDLAAPPLSAFLENIPQQAAGFEFKGIGLVERRDYYVNCNWKVYVDNYLEGYHIPIVHPGLMKEIDYPRYRTEVLRYSSQQLGPVKELKPGETGDRVYPPGPGLKEALYFWVFPNLMLNIYPDNIQTNVIVPLGHDRTLTIFEWYVHDAHSEKARERMRKTISFSEIVQQEDIHICEAVQRGLQSSTYDRGRYSVKRENGVHHFHMLLSEFLQST
ncbi:MAG TPA: SRPBCC family protein [Candidatus Limnocylindrales bacterium]|nr:SRPBCC family protein [Candidatus Limnocylindrales bacterium]